MLWSQISAPHASDPAFTGVITDIDHRIETLRQAVTPDRWARNMAGGRPQFEADQIRNSGLAPLVLADPERPYDRAEFRKRWAKALEAIRRLSRSDMSTAALLGYHYMHLLRICLAGNTDVTARAEALTRKGDILWGGANNPNGHRAEMVELPGQGFRLTGQKFFATGAQTADQLVIGEQAHLADGSERRLTFILRAQDPRIDFPDDWSGIGARRSASSSVVFNDVMIPYGDVFSEAAPDPAKRSLAESLGSLAFQMLFINFFAGCAEGMIETVTKVLGNPKGRTPSETALRALGDAVSRSVASGLMADRANTVFTVMLADLEEGRLDWQGRGQAADIISQAKIFTDRTTQEVTNRLFEAGGSQLAGIDAAISLYWSDARMFSMHDALSTKEREVGEFAIWGRAAVPSANS